MGSVTQTLGLMTTFLDAPVHRSARARARTVLGFAFRPSRRRDPQQVAAVATSLVEAHRLPPKDDEPKGCLLWLAMPFIGVAMAFGINQMMVTTLFVNPLLRRSWRARRYEADATAVELTRQPDAVAKGLAALTLRGGVVPGAEPVAHLFVVGPEAGIVHDDARHQAQQAELGDLRGRARYRAVKTQLARDEQEARRRRATGEGPDTERFHDMAGWQPPIDRRLGRLARLGATVQLDISPRPPMGGCAKALLVLVLWPLVFVFYAVLFALTLATLVVGLMVTGIFLFGPALVLHAVLRGGG